MGAWCELDTHYHDLGRPVRIEGDQFYENGWIYMKVGIIGAGPAGLACAYQLAKAGVKTDVYEAGGAVGGLARSFSLWNQTVDLGPHRFFSKDPRVNKLWLEVVGRDYSMVDRLTRILYNNKLYQYPLKPIDVVGKLGAAETARSAPKLPSRKNCP